jgi:hypothetical protein
VLVERLPGDAHDVPRLRLIQMDAWKPLDATAAAQAGDLSPVYRDWLSDYRQQLVSTELLGRR